MASTRMPRRIAATVTLAMLLATSSCQNSTLYHRHIHIGQNGWNRQDTLVFEVPVITKGGMCHIDTEVRALPHFCFKTLWLARKVEITPAHAETAGIRKVPYRLELGREYTDTIRIDTGSSDGISGVTIKTFEHQGDSLMLEDGEKVTVKLFHIMDKEIMPDILDAGIRLRTIE